jgi:hypothetical protein
MDVVRTEHDRLAAAVCVLCHSLAGEEHWSDHAPGSEPPAVTRARRRRLLTLVLGAYGLDYADDTSGLTALVSDRKGDTRVVRGLGELWPAAAQVCGRRLDPLDLEFLRRLAEAGG